MVENSKLEKLQIEPERLSFRALLAQNPNYFGNLVNSTYKPVKTILGNTTYEEISCVGFNPDKDLLEATIKIKLPVGYGTDLCHAGTYEYVRFYLNYGSGWEDAGVAGFNIHDIPNIHDCAQHPDKPLTYVVTLQIDPKRNFCGQPVLPRVRAILSWNHIPPPAMPNWPPVWGNVVERHIQIRPRPWIFRDVVDVLTEGANLKLKIPSVLEPAALQLLNLPDPPPLDIAQLAGLYAQVPAADASKATKETTSQKVESHRFALHELHPALTATAFNQDAIASKIEQFKAIGLDWSASLASLLKTSGDTNYEQLHCLGLDYQRERLVATFTIKRPFGYSGDLCHRGSTEYVAFWADWDNTCQWQYVGTVKVQVHDIAAMPSDGLQYSAILPVDLTKHRRACKAPRISRVRAVLSWSIPPSSTNPEEVPYWGNRLDAHVQLQPAGSDVIGEIRAIGGIPVEDIDAGSTGSGLTLPAAVFWYDGVPADSWGLHRQCPFGGQVLVHGQFFLGRKYRVKVRKVSDPPGTFQVVTTSFNVLRWAPGFDTQTADANGFFTYLDPALYMDRTLAVWNTSGDDLWELQLDIADLASPPNILGSTSWYRIRLDNTAPTAMITPDAGECKKWLTGDVITGHFTATDLHFGGYGLSTHPNTTTTPSNQPVSTTGQPATTPTSAGHDTWQLDTGHPIAMRACGYVVRLDVSDLSIVNSLPGYHNSNAWETGLCLVSNP